MFKIYLSSNRGVIIENIKKWVLRECVVYLSLTCFKTADDPSLSKF